MLSICLPVLISICKQDISKTDLWTLAKLIADDTVYVLSWRCLIVDADRAEDGRLSAVSVSVTLLAVSLNPFNASCSKLLLFQGFNGILNPERQNAGM